MATLQKFIEASAVRNFILIVIILNAIVLGLETSDTAVQHAGTWLKLLDQIAVGIFVAELAIKLIVYRLSFFKSGWNVFDFIIVSVTLMPAGDGTSVLRALRIVRAFRLMSAVPSMRLVIQAMLNAIPGMASVIALLSLVFYVGAVMATVLFGERFEDWFGTIGASLYSLFQIMTLESWSMGIVRPVMEQFPLAWMFFVPFILCTSFAVLNLFIAIIVSAMDDVQRMENADETSNDDIVEELRALRQEVAKLKKKG
ncbi:MAG: ion transporter [Rhodospirillaceae bacterium]|nr:ion transporter [Rhodospirillaceae bacterium]